MKKITIEEHFITDEYLDSVRSMFEKEEAVPGITPEDWVEIRGLLAMFSAPDTLGGTVSSMSKLLDVGEGRLKDMDEAGIDMQVLSLVPGVQIIDASSAITLAKKVNDRLSKVVKAHPQRFAGLATIPPQAPDAAAAELKRAVSELGLKGAMIFSHVKGEYLDDKKFWAIFEMAEKLDVPIYIHPRPPSPDMIKPFTAYPGLDGAMWGYSAEAGLHAMRLILSGLFDKYPGLQIILGHMGEGLPYWLWRMDNHWAKLSSSNKLKKTPSEYVKNNFYIDTSGMFWLPPLMCAYLALGADRILFAVDYPFESAKDATQFIDTIPISDGDKEKICHLNLEKLLKL